VRLDDEPGERISDHAPHVVDVQEARGEAGMTDAFAANLVLFAYLVAATLFILALRWMSSPETARRAVNSAIAAMTIAVVATLLRPDVIHYEWIAVAAVLGTMLGIPLARVPLTAVPERTGLSQSFGGMAAALVGTAK